MYKCRFCQLLGMHSLLLVLLWHFNGGAPIDGSFIITIEVKKDPLLQVVPTQYCCEGNVASFISNV